MSYWCLVGHLTKTESIPIAFDLGLELNLFLMTVDSQVFCHVKKVILIAVTRMEPRILRDIEMRRDEGGVRVLTAFKFALFLRRSCVHDLPLLVVLLYTYVSFYKLSLFT